MGDFYQDIRDRANQRRAAINNGLPNARTLGFDIDQSVKQQLAPAANKPDFLEELDRTYKESDTVLTNSLDAREDVMNLTEGTEVGNLLGEASENAWLTGEIVSPVPSAAAVTKYGGKTLSLLDDGVTAANKVLDKYDIQPGLSIKRIDTDGISKTNGKPVVAKADLDSFKKKRQANIENHKEVGMDVEDADEATTLAHYQETGQVIRYDPENQAYVVISSDVGKFETPELVDNDYFSGDVVDGRFVYDNANTTKELKMDDAFKYPEYFDEVPEAKNIKMNASLLSTDSVPPKFQKSKELTEQWDNMTPAQKENAVYADGGAISSG